jgi:predicted RNA-binding protein with PIN domain
VGHAGVVRLVVDGMNVIGARPDGWWRDRAGARRRLLDELATWASQQVGVELTVVFDGTPRPGELEAARGRGVDVRFAPGGPNAADSAIVALVEADADPRSITVVSSDGALVDTVRALGASVQGVGAFRRRLSG